MLMSLKRKKRKVKPRIKLKKLKNNIQRGRIRPSTRFPLEVWVMKVLFSYTLSQVCELCLVLVTVRQALKLSYYISHAYSNI